MHSNLQQSLTAFIRLSSTTAKEGKSTTADQSGQQNLSGTSIFPEEEFRTLQILPPKKGEGRQVRSVFKKNVPPARSKRMSTDQHWPSVWPAARTFHPAVVPLPVHMGFIERKDRYAPPGKWANAELMKIPNFLHLTPPAVKAHCQAIKKFCTPWPKELENDQDCERHFPLEVVFTDFVSATPSIRDPRSRLVKMIFRVQSLPMDHHARDKIKRLFNCNEKRYDEKTDVVVLTADRCPMRKQNYDFLQYILTAAFFEAWKKEDWEVTEKTPQDWEKYLWRESESFKRIVKYLTIAAIDADHKEAPVSEVNPEALTVEKRMKEDPVIKSYEESLTSLFDSGETEESLQKYKESVVGLLFGNENKGETKDQ